MTEPSSEARSALAVMPDEAFRAAFDRAPSGISITALDGRRVQVNDSYCRMLGYERGVLLEGSFLDGTPVEEIDEARGFLAAARAGKSDSLDREKRYLRKDGSVVWARVRTQLIRDQARVPLYFVSHVHDITERREALDQLHDSERTLRSMIDNTPAVICVKDRHHRYQLVNREFEQALGVSSDQIVGHSDAEILAPRNDGLNWSHCDGLKWPHFVRRAAEDAVLIERGSEAARSGVQSGVVRADQAGLGS